MQKYCSHSSHTVRERISLPHGMLPCFEAFLAESPMISRSAAFTLGCSRGSSRNHRKKKNAQITPKMPNTVNAPRHDIEFNTHTTSSGVKAPPQRALSHMMPCARTRSPGGIQIVNALVMFGKQPASPIPKQNRQTTSETKPNAQPVSAVKTDHISTTR